jgi:cytochrome P450
MFELMNRFTLDTIGLIGFSKDIGSLEDPTSPFLKSFDFAQQSMIRRFWTGQNVELWKVFRLFGLFWEKKLPSHFATMTKYCNGIVDDLMAKVQSGDDNSFVGLFMKDPEGQKLMKQDEKKFRVFLRDMILNFLLAGRDTTAQCLTWTLFELAQAHEVVQKARAEVTDVCGPAQITYNNINSLRYIRAILDESLRLHPSVPMDGKHAVGGDTLPNGTVIRAGTNLQYNSYAQGRSHELWGKDAEVFRPERWLERSSPPTPYEFVAFHAGPRECLGRRLAGLEMTMFVASFVRDFDFALSIPAEEVKYDIQLTLGCSTGLPMTVTARQ